MTTLRKNVTYIVKMAGSAYGYLAIHTDVEGAVRVEAPRDLSEALEGHRRMKTSTWEYLPWDTLSEILSQHIAGQGSSQPSASVRTPGGKTGTRKGGASSS